MISIIITTKNEELNIENCINSINNSNIDFKYEILLIDNFSSDNTLNLVDKYKNVIIYKKGPERSSQRNFGVKKSRYEKVIFLDADMIVSKNLLKEVVNSLNQDIDALYIPENILGKSFVNKIRNYERKFYNNTYVDCVRAFNKNVFNLVNGFDESMSGPEDWDFNNKVIINDFKISNTKNLIYHNEENINLIIYLRKKNYYSNSMDKYIDKWGKNSKFIQFQLGLFNRYFKIFFINKNYKYIIKHPLLFVFMYLLKVTVGIIFVSRNR